MAERHISPQQHYCIFGESFNLKIWNIIIWNLTYMSFITTKKQVNTHVIPFILPLLWKPLDTVLFVTTGHLKPHKPHCKGECEIQSMVPTRHKGHLLSNNSNLCIEDNIPWKRTFNERHPLLKDELWSKMTFNVSFFQVFDQKSLVSSS